MIVFNQTVSNQNVSGCQGLQKHEDIQTVVCVSVQHKEMIR